MTNHFNQLTPEQNELLAILAEECAEVIQIIGKIQRHGLDSINPLKPEEGTNTDRLMRELGDVDAAMVMLANAGVIDASKIPSLCVDKLRRIGPWLHHHEVELP